MGTWLGLGAPVPQGLPLTHRAEPMVRTGEKRTQFSAFDDPLFKKGASVGSQKAYPLLDPMLQLRDGPLPAGLFFSGQATRIPPLR
jgi:hypothetical protein